MNVVKNGKNTFITGTVSSGSEEIVELKFGTSKNISLAVFPAGTARVEFSISSYDDLTAGTANWIVWGNGEVSTPTPAEVFSKISAIKVVSVAGSTDYEVML